MSAIYHLSAKLASRSSGRSAVAMCCYRCAIAAVDPDTGIEHDYTHRRDVVDYRTLLPDNAPERLRSITDEAERAIALWSAVEAKETSSRAVLANEMNIAVDRDLPEEERVAVLGEMAEWLRDQGMGVTWAYHRGGEGEENPHGHFMLTMRGWTDEGEWEAKRAPKEYLCRDREGEERYMTGPELKQVRDDGWEKVYRYPGCRCTDREWLEMHPDGSIHDRLSKDAVQAPARAMHEWQEWDTRAQAREQGYYRQGMWLDKVREKWEITMNDAYERLGMEREISRLSYEDQGIDRVPTVHEGWRVREMEERGELAWESAYNIVAREHNDLIEWMEDNPIEDEELQRREIDRVLGHGLEAADEMREAVGDPVELELHVEQSRQWIEEVREGFERLREQVRELADQARELAREAIERARGAVERVIEAFNERHLANLEVEEREREIERIREDEMPDMGNWQHPRDLDVELQQREEAVRDKEDTLVEQRAQHERAERDLRRWAPLRLVNREKYQQALEHEQRTRGWVEGHERGLAERKEALEQTRADKEMYDSAMMRIEPIERARDELIAERDAIGRRAVELYDQLNEPQRVQADRELHERGDLLHRGLLAERGRDLREEEILRTVRDPVERCVELIRNIGDRECSPGWLEPRLDRLEREMESMTQAQLDDLRERESTVSGIGWDDIEYWRTGELELDEQPRSMFGAIDYGIGREHIHRPNPNPIQNVFEREDQDNKYWND